jgi:hypothetical protein
MAYDLPDDDVAMNFTDWCRVNGFSENQGRTIRESGRGPKFFRPTPRLLLITRGENRRWRQSLQTEPDAA